MLRTPLSRASDIIREVADADPDVIALAERLSLALVADPALIRAARQKYVPSRGPDLEAGLWNSALVVSSSASGVVFDVHVADALQRRLARSRPRYEETRRFVENQHDWLPDTYRIEEQLRALPYVAGGADEARSLLARLEAVVGTEEGEGLRMWSEGMRAHLPVPLRSTITGGSFARPLCHLILCDKDYVAERDNDTFNLFESDYLIPQESVLIDGNLA